MAAASPLPEQQVKHVRALRHLTLQDWVRSNDMRMMIMLSCFPAGWDTHDGGSVYAIPLGGTLLKVPYSIGGSGSAYITGATSLRLQDNHCFAVAAAAAAPAAALLASLSRNGPAALCRGNFALVCWRTAIAHSRQ
jgi:20S proteasome alpha/beta subunit